MPISFNATLPKLSQVLGETPDTLRAYQRSFVRSGLLASVPGKGPGSGVPASPMALAQFLIGVCCQATIAANIPLARTIARATATGDRCDLTGARTFVDALSAVLSDEAMAARVLRLIVSASVGATVIEYDGMKSSIFWKPRKAEGVQLSATITGPTLVSVVKHVISSEKET